MLPILGIHNINSVSPKPCGSQDDSQGTMRKTLVTMECLCCSDAKNVAHPGWQNPIIFLSTLFVIAVSNKDCDEDVSGVKNPNGS